MSIRTGVRSGYAFHDASAAPLRFEPTGPERALPTRAGPAETILHSSVFLAPPSVRPYFAACAVECWHRVPVWQLAALSGIPIGRLKRWLAPTGITPASVAAWNLSLHAAWLLDVAELPAAEVVLRMQLGRTAALGVILGARAVRFTGGKVEPGAFTRSLEHYIAVLRDAFRV
jgi:hypothetical protein